MPYYTHFTSPIRRFPDVIVHRLLQATLEGEEAIRTFPLNVQQIQQLCAHCSGKQMASKEAQQRCDRVYLSLYLRKHPMKSQLGIVLSVGQKSFTVFIPSLGADALLYLDEHKDVLEYSYEEQTNGARCLRLQQTSNSSGLQWKELTIKVFAKLLVSIGCKEKPPIDIKLRLEGPYRE
jgi:DIS3-like exonuclease 2